MAQAAACLFFGEGQGSVLSPISLCFWKFQLPRLCAQIAKVFPQDLLTANGPPGNPQKPAQLTVTSPRVQHCGDAEGMSPQEPKYHQAE